MILALLGLGRPRPEDALAHIETEVFELMSLTVQLVRDRLCVERGIQAGVPRAAFAEYGGRRTAMDSQIINRRRKRPGRLLLADIRPRPVLSSPEDVRPF